MEAVHGLVIDAIAHAVLAVKRRREGEAVLADRHSSASANALKLVARSAEKASGHLR
jgi:hypothetical protein